MNNRTIISFENVTKLYRRGAEEVHAIEDVTLTINRGEYVAVMGPSGSGKTTFLNIAGCLDLPTGGTVRIDGREVSALQENELVEVRKRLYGFVFQQFFLIPTLSVLENVELPLLFARRKGATRAREILDMVGLSKRLEHLPAQLSGGEMQRVAIARSLINSPSILLADEPTGNLDSRNASHIMGIFEDLNRNGLTVVIVTHNPGLIQRGARAVKIEDGKVCA